MNSFDVIYGMLQLSQADKGIGIFFDDNNVKSVAIYGLGKVGVMVYEALKNLGIDIKYVIDKDADSIAVEGNEVTVVKPEDISKQGEVNLIVVTPMEFYYEIKDELETITGTDIISIGEIVEYCTDGEEFHRLRTSRKNTSIASSTNTTNKADQEQRSRKVLIFGGSSGIGKAIARRMVNDGADVVIVGRNSERLNNAVLEINSDKISVIQGDIADIALHEKIFEIAEKKMGGLDAFVNSAAVALQSRGRGFEPWDITESEWDEQADTDFKASFFLIRNEVEYFLKKGIAGNILNFSSNAAYMDITGAYGASKLAIAKWTRAFGKKYGHEGIIINCIAPGATFTPIVSSYAKSIDQPYKRHSIERFIRPGEIAELAHFCLGNEGVILCGSTIVADGGDEETVSV